MDLEKAIEHLKAMRNVCKDFDLLETRNEDVEVLNIVIDELKRTAIEAPVQKQLVFTIVLDKKEIAKIILDELRDQ